MRPADAKARWRARSSGGGDAWRRCKLKTRCSTSRCSNQVRVGSPCEGVEDARKAASSARVGDGGKADASRVGRDESISAVVWMGYGQM